MIPRRFRSKNGQRITRNALFSLGALLSIICATQSQATSKPSIVLMMIDNVGYGDLGCYGNPVIRTPNIDRLARQGVRCTDFYIVTSSCTPSRGALLTGRYPLRNGLTWQLSREENWNGIGLPHTEKLLPQYLKAANYVTACFGKWNIGFANGSRPTERGFDEFFGCRSGNIDYFTHVYNGQEDMYRQNEPVDVEGYSTDLFADAACEFIRRNADRPFFVYVPFNAAHVPNPKNKVADEPCIWQAPAEYFSMYGYSPDSQHPSEGYHAVMSALDAGIGKIVNQIDALDLTQSTIVILLSDNGGSVKPSLILETATNTPLRGGRTEIYEGGIRTAFIVRRPSQFPANSVCREPICNLDILPMLLSVAEVPMPKDRIIDGRDITATLAGNSPSPHQFLFFDFRKWSGARSGRWKIVRPTPDSPFELYDLKADFGETNNLEASRPEDLSQLSNAFQNWRQQFPSPSR